MLQLHFERKWCNGSGCWKCWINEIQTEYLQQWKMKPLHVITLIKRMFLILFIQKYYFAEFSLNQVKHRPNFTRWAGYRIQNVSRESEQKIWENHINFKNVLLIKRTSNRLIIRRVEIVYHEMKVRHALQKCNKNGAQIKNCGLQWSSNLTEKFSLTLTIWFDKKEWIASIESN